MSEIAALADALQRDGLTLAVAESLTSGLLASTIGAGDNASEWFRGGVVAYTNDVKFSVLGVPPGPVVSAECASAMAAGVRRLLGADVGIAVTGVGGPGEEEGKPAGTVFIGVSLSERAKVEHDAFAGPPSKVLETTVDRAIELAVRELAG